MKRLKFLIELLRAKAVWVIGALFGGISIYDALSSQLSLPKISDLFGLTHFPGWVYASGVLIVFQYALFEMTFHLREEISRLPEGRRTAPKPASRPLVEPDITLGDVGQRVARFLPNPTMQDVNREIADRVKLSDLAVWGRVGDAGIALIPAIELESATYNIVKNQVSVPTHWSAFTYEDIRMVQEEVDRFWPSTST